MVIDDHSIRVRLEPYRVPGINQTLVRAVLRVDIRTGSRAFKDVIFRVDSASSISTMSAVEARKFGIIVPRTTIDPSVETAAGPTRQVRHPGRIQVKILGLDQWQFDWPCRFIEHKGPAPKAALGLSGVLDDLLITLDGAYYDRAPYGWLILKRQE